MKVYISLPITGREVSEARQHADLVKAALSRQGHTVISPFEVYAGKNPDYYDYICADLRVLADCDAIMMCRRWGDSKGCRVEKAFADVYGKKVMFETVELL